MKYAFSARGNPNILATHKTTLEITKDSELATKGDCIIAVAADFSLEKIRELIMKGCKMKLTIKAAGMSEAVIAVANRDFCSNNEIVLRKGDFVSERTLGTHADKAAANLDRKLIENLHGNCKVVVALEMQES